MRGAHTHVRTSGIGDETSRTLLCNLVIESLRSPHTHSKQLHYSMAYRQYRGTAHRLWMRIIDCIQHDYTYGGCADLIELRHMSRAKASSAQCTLSVTPVSVVHAAGSSLSDLHRAMAGALSPTCAQPSQQRLQLLAVGRGVQAAHARLH
jgi:hypothetical protein